MKRIVAALAVLLTLTAQAAALDVGSIPPKFPVPWGVSAGSAYIRSIPQASQIGIQNGAASLTDGFPPLNFIPSSAGGVPPFGQDFNGILKQLSQWAQWQAAGAPVFYDSVFAAAVGGYPKGSRVASSVLFGLVWISQVDSNSTNPDTGGANWVQDPSRIQSGAVQAWLSSTIPVGFVIANGTSIGSASSGATQRANADTTFLYSFLWSNCGTCTVSGGKGANAAADFAANKTISTPAMQGQGLIGADTMGGSTTTYLNGVPIISGSTTVPGSTLGENTHTLTTTEMPAHQHSAYLNLTDPGHTHTYTTAPNVHANLMCCQATDFWESTTTATTSRGFTGITVTLGQNSPSYNDNLTTSTGGGGAHNNVERSSIVFWIIKL